MALRDELSAVRGEREKLSEASRLSDLRVLSLSKELSALKAAVEEERAAFREQRQSEARRWKAQLGALERRAEASDEESAQILLMTKQQAEELEAEAKAWEREAEAARADRELHRADLLRLRQQMDEERRAAKATVGRWQTYADGLRAQRTLSVLKHMAFASSSASKRRALRRWRVNARRARAAEGRPPAARTKPTAVSSSSSS